VRYSSGTRALEGLISQSKKELEFAQSERTPDVELGGGCRADERRAQTKSILSQEHERELSLLDSTLGRGP